MTNNPQLRSKKELIEKFINENLYSVNEDDIEDEFDKFWEEQKDQAYKELCNEENLDCKEVRKVVDKYIYEQRVPLKDEIVNTLKVKPKLLERQKIIPRVLNKIITFVEKFYDDMGTQTNVTLNNEYSSIENELLVAQPKPEYT